MQWGPRTVEPADYLLSVESRDSNFRIHTYPASDMWFLYPPLGTQVSPAHFLGFLHFMSCSTILDSCPHWKGPHSRNRTTLETAQISYNGQGNWWVQFMPCGRETKASPSLQDTGPLSRATLKDSLSAYPNLLYNLFKSEVLSPPTLPPSLHDESSTAFWGSFPPS